MKLLLILLLLQTSVARANDDSVQLFGLDASQLAAALADQAAQKHVLLEIEVIRSWGHISYDAVWRTVGKQFEITPYYGQDSSAFRTLVGEMRAKQQRPAGFTVTGGVFASLWQPNDDGRHWEVMLDLTAAQYQQVFNRYVGIGYRLKNLQVYAGADSQLRFAATFDDHGTGPWEARHGLTLAEFQAQDTAAKAQGYGLTSIEAYNDAGVIRYAARWLQGGVLPTGWYVNPDMTFQELQANLQQQKGVAGHSLVQLSAFTKLGALHFAGLWE